MKQLILPVPDTVSATYIVPVLAPVSTVEARRQVGKAMEAETDRAAADADDKRGSLRAR